MRDKDKIIDLFNIDSTKRQSATDLVMETVKKLLVTKKLKPEDKLPSETEMAERLNVSRGSVREAMKILSAFGIVDIKRGDGTYITSISETSIFDPLLFKLIIGQDNFNDLKELREIIEIGIIRLAVNNATDDDILALEDAYNFAVKMISEGKYEGDIIKKAEVMFHTTLGQSTKNKLVQIIYNYIMDLYIPNIYKDINDEDFGNEALSSHRLIIDAIINRDVYAGENAIRYAMNIWKEQSDRYKDKTLY